MGFTTRCRAYRYGTENAYKTARASDVRKESLAVGSTSSRKLYLVERITAGARASGVRIVNGETLL